MAGFHANYVSFNATDQAVQDALDLAIELTNTEELGTEMYKNMFDE